MCNSVCKSYFRISQNPKANIQMRSQFEVKNRVAKEVKCERSV